MHFQRKKKTPVTIVSMKVSSLPGSRSSRNTSRSKGSGGRMIFAFSPFLVGLVISSRSVKSRQWTSTFTWEFDREEWELGGIRLWAFGIFQIVCESSRVDRGCSLTECTLYSEQCCAYLKEWFNHGFIYLVIWTTNLAENHHYMFVDVNLWPSFVRNKRTN